MAPRNELKKGDRVRLIGYRYEGTGTTILDIDTEYIDTELGSRTFYYVRLSSGQMIIVAGSWNDEPTIEKIEGGN